MWVCARASLVLVLGPHLEVHVIKREGRGDMGEYILPPSTSAR